MFRNQGEGENPWGSGFRHRGFIPACGLLQASRPVVTFTSISAGSCSCQPKASFSVEKDKWSPILLGLRCKILRVEEQSNREPGFSFSLKNFLFFK